MAQGNIHIGLTAEDLRARLHILTALLIVFGLTALYSISDNPLSIESSFMRQFIFMILSFIVYLILRRVSLKAFHDNSTMIFLFTIGLCLVPFFLPRVEYTYRWIDLGFMTIQPSEYLKIGVIIAIAKYLSNHQLEMKTKSIVVIPGLLTLFGAAIVLRQPDLGTAAIVCAPLIPMLLWAGVNGFVLFLIIAPIITIIAASNSIAFSIWAVIMLLCFLLARPGVVPGSILYFSNIFAGLLTPFAWNILTEYQKQRVLTFLNPDLDPMGSAYHIIQSVTAIGSGGFFGKGFEQGSQTQLKFLPVQESDFILSVIAEEFGFLGIMIVMAVFFLFIKTLLDIAFKCSDYFSSIVIIGLASIFLSHLFVNSAMTVGLIPVKGLPLPFVSAGGSFLLSCFIMLALITNLSENS